MEYSELSGGQGNTARYRAPRQGSRALPGRSASVEFDGVHAVLHDVSVTGAAFYVDDASTVDEPAIGETRPLVLMLRGAPAFQSDSQVVRTEVDSAGTKVAVRFLDRLFDAGNLEQVHQRLLFEKAAQAGLDPYQEVPAAYRSICGEVALFLNHWRVLLGRREESLLQSGASEGDLTQCVDSALDQMRPEWQKLRLAANHESSKISDDDSAFAIARRYTQLQVSTLLGPSPFLSRCLEKPLGYPGDYVAMGWMYDRPRIAPTLFGRALDVLGFEERLAATVPDRKKLLVRYLEKVTASGQPVRILNVGSGPAREVEEFLDQTDQVSGVQFVLVDQDEGALKQAHDRLRRAALRHGPSVEVEPHFLSFRQLFANRELISSLAGQDLVYSAGLFDYLPEGIGADLLKNCARLLKPGGELAIGNAAQAEDVRWIPEFVLDWHMIYRTEDQMRLLAKEVDVPHRLRFEKDPSTAWHFLVVEHDR